MPTPSIDRLSSDIFMNNYTERTWVMVSIGAAIKDLMKTYVQYPPRKQQGESYSGPPTLQQYERFQYIRDALAKEGCLVLVGSSGNAGAMSARKPIA
jgi:hypothetical protein